MASDNEELERLHMRVREMDDENARLRAAIRALTTPDGPRVALVSLGEHLSPGRWAVIFTWPHGSAADEMAMGKVVAEEFARLMTAAGHEVQARHDMQTMRGRPGDADGAGGAER